MATLALAGLALGQGAWAKDQASAPPRPRLQPLMPQPVAEALRRAQLPPEALAAVVLPAAGGRLAGPRWQFQADKPMQPASTMKLVTSIVALDQLGPNLRGSTELWTRAPLVAGATPEGALYPGPRLAPAAGGMLQGDLIIRGGADPELGLPELWALMAELRWQGIRELNGDILLDRTLFNPPRPDLGQPPFDEQPEFPYNVVPDALHLAGSLMDVELRSDRNTVQARVLPALPDLVVDASALQLNDKPCRGWDDDWQSPPLTVQETGLDGQPVLRVLLRGGFPRDCVVRQPLQLIERNALAERLLRLVWQGLGGQWHGRVREAAPAWLPPPEPLPDPLARLLPAKPSAQARAHAGGIVGPNARAPAHAAAAAAAAAAPQPAASPGALDALPPRLLARRVSRPWGELLRTLNKRSDNAYSRLLYLQLGQNAMAGAPGVPTRDLAAQAVRAWLAAHRIPADGLVLDNGSGLSRSARIAPATLAAMLREAQRGRWASELLMSLPLVGIDGSMRNRLRGSPAGGWARMKTGTLRDTTALAGYVPDPQGRLWVVVAMVNHPQAAAGGPALDALVDWVARGGMTATHGDDALVLPVAP